MRFRMTSVICGSDRKGAALRAYIDIICTLVPRPYGRGYCLSTLRAYAADEKLTA